MAVYIDLTDGSDAAAGTEAAPWKTFTNVTTETDIRVKRGSSANLSPKVWTAIDNLTISDYGSGAKPILDSYIAYSSTGDWTEVDSDDGDTPTPGSNIWRLTKTSNIPTVFVSLATLASTGAAVRKEHWSKNGYPTTVDKMDAQGQWDELYAGEIDSNSYLFVYSVGNPATTIGTVYWGSFSRCPITIISCNNVKVENLQQEYGGGLVRLRQRDETECVGAEISNIDGDHVGSLIKGELGNSGKRFTDLWIHGCTCQAAQYSMIYISGHAENTYASNTQNVSGLLVEDNTCYESGIGQSIGGIYCAYACGPKPNVIRNNYFADNHFGRYWYKDAGAIYLDNISNNFRIYGNTIENSHVGLKDHSGGSQNAPNYWVGNLTNDCMVGGEASHSNIAQGAHESYWYNNNFLACGTTVYEDASLDDNPLAGYRFLTSASGDNYYAYNNFIVVDGTNVPYGMVIDTVGAGTYTEDYNNISGATTNAVNLSEVEQSVGSNDVTTELQTDLSSISDGNIVANPLLFTGPSNPFPGFDFFGLVINRPLIRFPL